MLEKNRVIPHGCDSHSLIMARWPPYHTLTTPINNTILLQTAARSWLEKHLLCAPLLLCCHVSMLCPRLQSQGAIWGDWLKQSWETRTLNHKSLGNTRVRHFSALLPARKLLLMSFTTKTCISPSVDLIPSLPFLLPAIYSHQMTSMAGRGKASRLWKANVPLHAESWVQTCSHCLCSVGAGSSFLHAPCPKSANLFIKICVLWKASVSQLEEGAVSNPGKCPTAQLPLTLDAY